MVKVSCIIPAYNEEKRIRNVLEIVAVHPLIDEIIVIDDGSVDETKKIVLGFEKIKLIIHEYNLGKSASLYDGIKNSSGEYLVFLDADLTNLKEKDLTHIILPVLSGSADISMSLRKNTPIWWRVIGIDAITGERVLPKINLMPYAEKILHLRPYAFEVFLNELVIKNKQKVKVVPWPTVGQLSKSDKKGIVLGLLGDFNMMKEIINTVTFWGLMGQIIKLRKLRIK